MQPVTPSSTDVTVHIRIIDAADGTPETGVTSATSGLALVYRKGATGAVTGLTESDLGGVNSAHSDGGMIHVNGGLYRVDLPDAAVPTAEHEVTWIGGTITDMIVIPCALVGKPVEVVSGSLVAASVSGAVGSVTARVTANTDQIEGTDATDYFATLDDALTTLVNDLPTNAELATALASADDAVLAAIANLDTQLDALPTATENAAAVWTVGNLTTAAVNRIADVVLRRTTANVEASIYGDTVGGRSLYGAVARLVHKVSVSGATMTVTQSDDTTSLTTATLTTNALAEPTTAVDPAP